MSAQPEPALQSGRNVAHSQAQLPADERFQASRLAAVDATELVVSASEGGRETLEMLVTAQALELGWKVQPLQTVVEKRATFACVPGLVRPPMAVAPRMWACGDYVEGPYPATLEGAVRSGLAVADRLG